MVLHGLLSNRPDVVAGRVPEGTVYVTENEGTYVATRDGVWVQTGESKGGPTRAASDVLSKKTLAHLADVTARLRYLRARTVGEDWRAYDAALKALDAIAPNISWHDRDSTFAAACWAFVEAWRSREHDATTDVSKWDAALVAFKAIDDDAVGRAFGYVPKQAAAEVVPTCALSKETLAHLADVTARLRYLRSRSMPGKEWQAFDVAFKAIYAIAPDASWHDQRGAFGAACFVFVDAWRSHTHDVTNIADVAKWDDALNAFKKIDPAAVGRAFDYAPPKQEPAKAVEIKGNLSDSLEIWAWVSDLPLLEARLRGVRRRLLSVDTAARIDACRAIDLALATAGCPVTDEKSRIAPVAISRRTVGDVAADISAMVNHLPRSAWADLMRAMTAWTVAIGRVLAEQGLTEKPAAAKPEKTEPEIFDHAPIFDRASWKLMGG